jgi:hypothetical protein
MQKPKVSAVIKDHAMKTYGGMEILRACFLLGLFFDPEDGSNIFHRNAR